VSGIFEISFEARSKLLWESKKRSGVKGGDGEEGRGE
jgi:hypothetical protein